MRAGSWYTEWTQQRNSSIVNRTRILEELQDIRQDAADSSDKVAQDACHAEGLKWWLVVLSILSSIFTFSLVYEIVAVVQPAIVKVVHSIRNCLRYQ